jgi:hypothetical protein
VSSRRESAGFSPRSNTFAIDNPRISAKPTSPGLWSASNDTFTRSSPHHCILCIRNQPASFLSSPRPGVPALHLPICLFLAVNSVVVLYEPHLTCPCDTSYLSRHLLALTFVTSRPIRALVVFVRGSFGTGNCVALVSTTRTPPTRHPHLPGTARHTTTMGNSQTKHSRPGSSREQGGLSSNRHGSSPTTATFEEPSRHGRSSSIVYSSRSGRGSRHDLSFLGIGSSSERDPALEPRRETKAEREARKLEKERQVRAQERERSLREEGIDGGFLVTLGTYTGPEDFSKPIVRQLQVWAIQSEFLSHLT